VSACPGAAAARLRAPRRAGGGGAHRDDDTGELFGIAELCAEFGITLRTIRFYEDKGLLSPRRINGTRVYTRRDRARLALILRSPRPSARRWKRSSTTWTCTARMAKAGCSS
jgi:hypothetical protein